MEKMSRSEARKKLSHPGYYGLDGKRYHSDGSLWTEEELKRQSELISLAYSYKLNEIDDIMSLMPSGIPANEDTYANLNWWIMDNEDVVCKWKENPPTEEEEIEIYRSFGMAPIKNKK